MPGRRPRAPARSSSSGSTTRSTGCVARRAGRLGGDRQPADRGAPLRPARAHRGARPRRRATCGSVAARRRRRTGRSILATGGFQGDAASSSRATSRRPRRCGCAPTAGAAATACAPGSPAAPRSSTGWASSTAANMPDADFGEADFVPQAQLYGRLADRRRTSAASRSSRARSRGRRPTSCRRPRASRAPAPGTCSATTRCAGRVRERTVRRSSARRRPAPIRPTAVPRAAGHARRRAREAGDHAHDRRPAGRHRRAGARHRRTPVPASSPPGPTSGGIAAGGYASGLAVRARAGPPRGGERPRRIAASPVASAMTRHTAARRPDARRARRRRGRRRDRCDRAEAAHRLEARSRSRATRLAETAAYSKRHYGTARWRLVEPARDRRALHRSTASARRGTRSPRTSPDPELHELPGTCAHFVVDRDGTIYQLVRSRIRCRHTVGLNWTAIGIEHVGISDAGDPRQPAPARAPRCALTRWLDGALRHRAARRDRPQREPVAPVPPRARTRRWRYQTHGDWTRADMDATARGSPRSPPRTGCRSAGASTAYDRPADHRACGGPFTQAVKPSLVASAMCRFPSFCMRISIARARESRPAWIAATARCSCRSIASSRWRVDA